MGSIQSGQSLSQVNRPQIIKKSGGSISSGRKLQGITSYDENLRNKMFSDIAKQRKTYQDEIDAQKKAYDEEIAKQQAEIDTANAQIEQQNAELKASYDKAISDIQNMNVEQYKTYYYNIPDSIRNLFQTPEQIDVQLATEKQTRAEDTLNTIESNITSWTQRRDYAYQKMASTTGDESKSWDDAYNEANFWITALNNSKGYATGDYSKESVIDYATQLAQDYISRNYNSIADRQLRLVEENKLVEQYKLQGYEPVYQQVGTEKVLYNFVPTEPKTTYKSTAIPQTSLNLGLSPQQVPTENILTSGNEYYVDKLGQKVSYQPVFKYPAPKEESKSILFNKENLFSKYNNPLANKVLYQSNKPQYQLNKNIKILDIPLSQQRGTIGSPTNKIVSDFKTIPLEEEVINLFTGASDITTKGYERLFTQTFKQPLKQDIYFNLPQQTRGTMSINPNTLKYEIPRIPEQKVTVDTIFGTTAKVLGTAPELAAWMYAAPVIATPYIIRGSKTALNPNLPTTQRIGGGIEAGTSLAFGFGGKLIKLIPKEIKPRIITETTKIKIPNEEGVLGVRQVNPVEVYTDVYGNTFTKYNYQIKSIKPEVQGTTGQVTKVYKQNFFRDLLGKEPKLIYSGNPYVDKIGYKKAIKELKLTGTTEKQAKNLLRLTQPKYIESRISGQAITLFGEESKPISYLEAEQKITPKIIEVKGIKTRKFEPVDYLISSKGVETTSKGDIIFYKSTPSYTKTYMTKEGNIFSKLKQQGKTTEVYEQLSGIKSLGTRELKTTISDIGYARSYKPQELEAYKDITLSRKIIPKERGYAKGKGNILTSNIEEPIIVTYDNPIKITKEIKTGSLTGTNFKRGELTPQQKLIQELEFKPLSIVKEAKSNLIKEQQRVSTELIKSQAPKISIKPKEVSRPSYVGGMGGKESMSEYGFVSSKIFGSSIPIDKNYVENIEYLNNPQPTGRIEKSIRNIKSDAGISKDLVKGSNLTNIEFKFDKSYKEDNLLKNPIKELTNTIIKNPSELKFKTKLASKENEAFKTRQDQYSKQDFFNPNQPEQPKPTKPNEPIEDKTRNKNPPKPKSIFRRKEEVQKFTKAFNVLIRSKGKIQEIGKGLPYSKALKLGAERTKGSLAQTFALKELGTTKESDIYYRLPTNLFTTPKRSKTKITPLTFVERRGKTLTSSSEIRGIQREKSIKSRRIKWL